METAKKQFHRFRFRSDALKYGVGIIFCLILRLIPFRAPNVEPIMATVMPFAKHHGYLVGFLFGAGNIILYDLVTGTGGIWTLLTATAYGIVGMSAAWFLRSKNNSPLYYAVYAAGGTILYDAITGLTMGPLLFGQPFMGALVGQIPFTLMHLAGNVTLSALLSPLIYRWVVVNRALEPAIVGGVDKKIVV
ncbi:MAG: hypothetical protein NUV53_01940 [Patescibacteria group bacterium]|nr:hypothetical protein [Patescibacteria group bacterium]